MLNLAYEKFMIQKKFNHVVKNNKRTEVNLREAQPQHGEPE